MSPADYKAARQQRGTQESVAALLGVARGTVARRETGALPIPREAELALLALPKIKGRAPGNPNKADMTTCKKSP
jgi:transcriptional regulator with XRE-family HTH domain